MEAMTDYQRTEIKELAEKYGINIEDIHIKRFVIFLLNKPLLNERSEKPDWKEPDNKPSSQNLELAEFIELIIAAYENDQPIEVSTTIKGIKSKTVKLSGRNCYKLVLFANTELEHQQDGTYQGLFGWEFKDTINQHDYFTEPYTKEELDKILRYERNEEIKRKKSKKRMFVRQLNIIYYHLKDNGVFNNKTKEPTSKEYQFLYDSLCVLGMFPKDNMYTFSALLKKEALRDYIRKR